MRGPAREVIFERGQDVGNVVPDLIERLAHPPAIGRRSVIERYVEEATDIHVHVDAMGTGIGHGVRDFDLSEFCAVFEWPPVPALDQFRLQLRSSWIHGVRARADMDNGDATADEGDDEERTAEYDYRVSHVVIAHEPRRNLRKGQMGRGQYKGCGATGFVMAKK